MSRVIWRSLRNLYSSRSPYEPEFLNEHSLSTIVYRMLEASI